MYSTYLKSVILQISQRKYISLISCKTRKIKMKTSLVTGGAGFIGAHVVRELKELGHNIVVLDDCSGGFKENIPEGVSFIKGNILDHLLVDDLFEKYQFDYVYHLAAYAAEGLSHFIKRYNYKGVPMNICRVISKQILIGLDYLHRMCNLIHTDLKLENILVCLD